ncbi:MAG: peroxiredoxin [Pyrinomonadaceae bacterium]
MNQNGNSTSRISVGADAPDFSLFSDTSEEWSLAEHRDGVTVLLFYPQNETLVCTKQLCSLRDNWAAYLATKATIVGISPGTPEQHRSFAATKSLPIPLLADPNREITRLYAKHWLYPLSFTRAVVVIDAKGIIRNLDIMLRAFRPSDDQLITDIYAARGDELTEKYSRLKSRFSLSRNRLG